MWHSNAEVDHYRTLCRQPHHRHAIQQQLLSFCGRHILQSYYYCWVHDKLWLQLNWAMMIVGGCTALINKSTADDNMRLTISQWIDFALWSVVWPVIFTGFLMPCRPRFMSSSSAQLLPPTMCSCVFTCWHSNKSTRYFRSAWINAIIEWFSVAYHMGLCCACSRLNWSNWNVSLLQLYIWWQWLH